MRWRRLVAVVVVAASAVAIVSVPADAKVDEISLLCPIDPDTGECLPDRDRDGRVDTLDNCPDHWNPFQEDNDGDGIGNVCDPTPNGDPPPGGGGGGGGGGTPSPDADGDLVADSVDNCGKPDTPLIANPDQADTNADGLGNACDPEALTDGGGSDSSTEVPVPPGTLLAVFTKCYREVHVDSWDQAFLWKAIQMEIRAKVCYRLGRIASLSEIYADATLVREPWEWHGLDPGYPWTETDVYRRFVAIRAKGSACVHIPIKGCIGRKRHPWISVTFWGDRTRTSSQGVD